jgi:hypothetical protein
MKILKKQKKELTPVVRIWYESFRPADGLEAHYGDNEAKREIEDFINCYFKQLDGEYKIYTFNHELVAIIPKKNVHSIRKLGLRLSLKDLESIG